VILDHHAALAARLRNPDDAMTDWWQYYMDTAWQTQVRRSGHGSSMFWPAVPYDAEQISYGQARQTARLVAAGLREAETFQVTEQMVDRITADMATLPAEKISKFDLAALPSPAGFAWLDKPWRLGSSPRGTNFVTRAVSWQYIEVPTDTAGTVPAARVAMWAFIDDLPGPHANARLREDIGPLAQLYCDVIPFGMRFNTTLIGEDDPDTLVIEITLSLIHMLWKYLGMTILTERRQAPISPQQRKRHRKTLRHGKVSIILLRREVHPYDPDAAPGHRDVDWSCRWPVDGHYRHLDGRRAHKGEAAGFARMWCEDHQRRDCWHCEICGGPMCWIGDYLKGPPGKPLKPHGQKLYRLAR
jgi:hypothetical protein